MIDDRLNRPFCLKVIFDYIEMAKKSTLTLTLFFLLSATAFSQILDEQSSEEVMHIELPSS